MALKCKYIYINVKTQKKNIYKCNENVNVWISLLLECHNPR